MKRLALLVAPVLAVAGCGARSDKAIPKVPESEADLVSGELVVELTPGSTQADLDAIDKATGVDFEWNTAAEGPRDEVAVNVASYPGDEAALEKTLAANAHVRRVEPLARYQALFVPNDPRYPEQWNLKMIRMEEAWDRSTGKGVVVAVIDTGIAFEDHDDYKLVPDLKGASFVPGYNFVAKNDHPNDDQGHGTHVAGTIAQSTNNSEGVAGIAFDAKLMPLKVLTAQGFGTTADIADAIEWAADHGAQVINMSLGGPFPSKVLEDACDYAHKKGVVVVAAAGNSGQRCPSGCVGYPAGFDGVIAVSAVGPKGEITWYSSWGKQVDIAAPGGDLGQDRSKEKDGILQATINPGDGYAPVYRSYMGTSMASPHVAGVAALLIAAGAKTPEQVEKALYEGAKAKGDRDKYGHGLLDAEASLEKIGAAAAGPRDLATIGWRVVLAAALIGWARASLRKRRVALHSLSLPFLLGALMGAAGLFFLPWLGLGNLPVAGKLVGLLAQPLPDWERAFLGRSTPIFYSVAVPVLLALAGLPFARLRRFNAGLAAGFGAFLLQTAWLGASLPWLPDHRLVIAAWLLVNGLLGGLLCRELIRLSALAPESA